MTVPLVPSRVEQGDGEPGVRVDCRSIAAFVPVAKDTCVGEVFERGISAMFAAENVIDLVRMSGIVFVDQAVFAAGVGAFGNLLAKGRRNVTCQVRE